MEWDDEGVVLASRPHGEADAVVALLTFDHGRHLGLVKGGRSRRLTPLLQTGNRVRCQWQARLADQLGRFTVEPVRLYTQPLLDDPLALAAVASAGALVEATLAEREPHPEILAGFLALLARLVAKAGGLAAYVRFELLLLQVSGFALNLDACAVTGATDDLAYVSPRTGRAVSRIAAGDLAPRLLALPAFLREDETVGSEPPPEALLDGLRLTGFFLQRHLLDPADRALPAARDRLVDLVGQRRDAVPA